MDNFKWLDNLSENEIMDIIKPINHFLFDIDGVLLLTKQIIPGADKFVKKMRELGKKIGFVTNNTFYPKEKILNYLKAFDAKLEELTTPLDGIMHYLNKIKFKKDIFVIGSNVLIDMLKDAGYAVIESKDIINDKIENNFDALLDVSNRTLKLCDNVGAVILCGDFNFTTVAAQIAITILTAKKDVILLSGMCDEAARLNGQFIGIGTKYYIDAIQKLGKRKCQPMAKPGVALTDVVMEKYSIKNPDCVLFIGDNVGTDIAFGLTAGFQTLLVLSGITTKGNLYERLIQEQVTPNYVADSLKHLYEKCNFSLE